MDPSRSIDPEALLRLAPFVHRLARALLRDPELAHDVAQDALTAALRQPASAPMHHLRGWLAAVTRRLAERAQRRRRERQRRELRAARPAATDDDATAERLRLQRALSEAVLALPEPYRTAVTLRYLDELSVAQVARRTGVRADAARQRVHRGLQLLRQRLDRDNGSGWRAAFVTAGLGVHALPWTVSLSVLVPSVLAMKKILAAAAVMLALTAIWIVRWTDAPTPYGRVDALADIGAAAEHGGDIAAAADAAPRPEPTARQVAPELHLRVTDTAGAPQPELLLRVWSDHGPLQTATTGRDGRAALPGVERPGRVLVAATSRSTAIHELPMLIGEHVLVLPDAELLSGHVLVDGAPAPAGMVLRVLGGGPPVPRYAPPEITALLDPEVPIAATTTAADGSFAVRGLPRDWRGAIAVPHSHWVLPPTPHGDERHLQLDAPRRDLILQTTRLPGGAGRIVWDDDGAPVRGARLMAFARFVNGDDSPATGIPVDDDGRFTVGLCTGSSVDRLAWADPQQRPALASLELSATHPEADRNARATLQGDGLRDRFAVELRLTRELRAHVRVVDTAGRPIAGARIAWTKTSPPTDDDGRTVLPGRPPGRTTPVSPVAVVVAEGHLSAPLEASTPGTGTADDPHLVVLDADNELVVRLRDRAGAPVPGLTIVLEGEDWPFSGRRRQVEPEVELGSTTADCSASGSSNDGRTVWHTFEARCTPDAAGDVVLRSLEPSATITIHAIDGLRSAALTRPIQAPAAGERRVVDLVIDAEPRILRGRVHGADGSPIAAGVTVTCEDHTLYLDTGADGSFTRALFTRAPLELTARADDFVGARRRLGPTEDECDLLLAPATTVDVRVVDADGKAVDLLAEPEGHADHLDRLDLGPGHTRWSNQPIGAVTFACEFGGERFTVLHDTRQPEAVLRVPTPARLTVRPPPDLPTPKPTVGYLAAAATRLDAPGAPFRVQLSDAASRPDLLLPGRYRVALILREWHGEPRELRERELGPSAEVTLAAGEDHTVTLR